MKIILQKLQTMNHLQRRQCSLGHQNLCNTAMVERPVYEIEIMNVKFVPKKKLIKIESQKKLLTKSSLN